MIFVVPHSFINNCKFGSLHSEVYQNLNLCKNLTHKKREKGKMSKVDVISSSLVPMATNDSTSMPRTELTPWDLHLLQLYPIQKGILFRKPDLEKTTNLVGHLRKAFARALDFFPPLAGRLGTVANDDGTTFYFVDCNNAGAEFTHAGCSLSVADISEAKYVPGIVSASFFPLDEVRNIQGVSNPLLGVQITELADGFFIGCTANHAVVDGTSFWHFINSWAEISRGLGKISRIPVFERDFPNGDRAIPVPTVDTSNLHRSVQPPLLERVFHFSKGSVYKLKAKANEEAGSDKISSLQALLAHLWRGVVRARCNNNDRVSNRDLHLALPVGARTRIPLPEGYFGNAIFLTYFGITEAELIHEGLGHTGLKLNAFVAQQTSHSAVFGYIENWVKNPTTMTKGVSDFLISSTPQHNVYGSDFGWGRPIAVRSGKAQKRDGKMTLFPAAEPGGVDIEVCLAPETLQALEVDTEFMEAVTT